MKTLTELKRDAASGKLKLELVERFGKTGESIPERLRGIRSAVGVNTVAIKLQNGNGEVSELRLPRSSLVSYDGKTLTVYQPGLRAVTDGEREVLRGAEAARACYERQYPGSDPYYKLVRYYAESPCPWMRPYGDEKQGKRYDAQKDKVLDRSVKGEAALRYLVHMD